VFPVIAVAAMVQFFFIEAPFWERAAYPTTKKLFSEITSELLDQSPYCIAAATKTGPFVIKISRPCYLDVKITFPEISA